MAVLIFGAYNMNMIVDDGLDLVMDGTCSVEDLGPMVLDIEESKSVTTIGILCWVASGTTAVWGVIVWSLKDEIVDRKKK